VTNGSDATAHPAGGRSMNIIAWIVLGAAAGWIASMIVGTNREQGWLMNIVLGIIGALLGGAIIEALNGGDFDFAFFDLGTWIAAIAGAIILSWGFAALTGRRST
jgi:uncharacterized membrane protein YeaQ/YmgE (transglycosylase-associated protein family)